MARFHLYDERVNQALGTSGPISSFYSAIMNATVPGVHKMSKSLKISGSIWITVWIAAILLTVVGGISPAESWRFNIQLPGIGIALLLMAVAGPFALMFGASGGVFLVLATILTNALAYAALITLVLAIRGVFKKQL